MELRGHCHLHYIQAIRGGLLKKVLNVNSCGQPALKFKAIKDIYDAEDAKNHNHVPKIHLWDDMESSPSKLKGFKVESSYSPLEESVVKLKHEASELNYKNGAGERNDDLDDLSIGNMTLTQIKERCRTKKRKYSNQVGLGKEPVGTLFSLKRDDSNFEQDHCDLEEPLINWKHKLSKNMKSKKKCSRKHVSTSSCNVISVAKLEQGTGDQGFLHSEEDWPAPLNVKVAVSDLEFSDCQAVICLRAVTNFGCSDQVDSVGVAINETTDAGILNEGVLVCLPEEHFCGAADEVPYEFIQCAKPEFDVGVSGWEIAKVDSPEILDYKFSDISEFNNISYITSSLPYDFSSESHSPTEDHNSNLNDGLKSNSSKHMFWLTSSHSRIECHSETAVSMLEYPTRESHCTTVSEASYEDAEDVHSKFNVGFSGCQIVKVDSPEINNYCSNSSESKKGGCSIYPTPPAIPSESLSPTNNHGSEMHDGLDKSSAEHDIAWVTRCQSQIQLPDMAADINLQCSKDLDWVNHCLFEEISKNNCPSKLENSVINSSSDYLLSQNLNSYVSPGEHSVSASFEGAASFDSFSAEKPSPLSTLAEAVKGHPITRGTLHEFMASPQLGHYPDSKLHPPPQRLISARKTISPTSQERLCRAVESTVSVDNEHRECRGKLYFAKQTSHRILRAEGLEQFSRAVATSIMSKPKHGKGILKVPHLPCSVPQPTSCMSTQSCSENAIAFSQRQMHDIESLATKLTKELKSMKDIMKVRLQLEDTTAPALKQNTDEMKIAIDNAERAEETTIRWLSIMARDCSRFCKIMKSTKDRSSPSENLIHKKRKITFADEAGGKLCHVKVFNDDMASALAFGSENQSLPVE
ncbi:hypothetical protein SLE2022_215650 [Rubroshorea leprosula]